MAIILRPTLWEDELGRLRLWSANIGAHQTSQSALDFRLRDASHIKNQIVKLLQGLHQILQDVGVVLTEIEGPIQEALPADEDPETELEQLLDNIKTMINCLFQMSMLVRKPTRHDFFAETQKPETSWFELYDQGHVRDKHPHANEHLVRRLGFAMTRRRKYLKYRERHRAKLSMGLDVSPEVDEEGTNILSETVATGLQTGHVESEDKAPEAAMSDTSYASTILEGGAITIPLPPKEAIGGAPFECPYCFFMISIKGSRAWPMHVFQDLQPYVCLFPTCTTPHKMYSSRREWFRHLRGAHLAEWARGQYESSAASTNNGARSTLHAICPLCGSESGSETHFEHHLARHLQELALFVLPRGENEEEAIESEAEVDSIDANEGLEMSDHNDSHTTGQIWEEPTLYSSEAYVPFEPHERLDELRPTSYENKPVAQSSPNPNATRRRRSSSASDPGAKSYVSRQTSASGTTLDNPGVGRRSFSLRYNPQISPNISGNSSPTARTSPSHFPSTNSIPNRDYILGLPDPNRPASSDDKKRVQKHPATFQCSFCPKKYTRLYNLRSHVRTHTEERPFVCSFCGKAFARQHDRKRHEGLHSDEKKFVCRGELGTGGSWGCGRRFARGDDLFSHFKSEAGRVCLRPVLDEEFAERKYIYEQMRGQSLGGVSIELQAPVHAMSQEDFAIPAVVQAQYPELHGAQMDQPRLKRSESRGSFSESSAGQGFEEDEGASGYVSGPGISYSAIPSGESALQNRDWASDDEGA
ncbi:hypothetical protein OEA41_009455 [Lepraria neglecta]|uniref:C2H2-type domain-containing protein n=1 Tax=Lepraria neglecta TaxID=209136 RepID=A0AAD9Z2C9_9LECA|nr:hypothetical protein OEA41_009455 [Lepraria neglecta]